MDQAVSEIALSVVIPFYNEADNVRFVIEEARHQLPEAEILAHPTDRHSIWDIVRRTRGRLAARRLPADGG